jgi:hypothetical protein
MRDVTTCGVCVCVFRYCVQTHNTMKYTTDQSHLHHSPLPPHFTCYKKRAILLLLACESVVIKRSIMGRNSCGEMIISGVIVLCFYSAGRPINWGAAVRSLRSDKLSRKQPDEASQCRTNSVKCSCQSVRSVHLSYRPVHLTFPFLVTSMSRISTLIFSERITPETIRK